MANIHYYITSDRRQSSGHQSELDFYGAQAIYLPGAGSLYTVERGDTMKKIACRHGTTLKMLIALNPKIGNVNLIYPGQVIRVW